MHDSDKFTCVFKDSKEKEICANRLDEQYEEHPEGKWSNNCVMTCILERKKKKKKKIYCHGELSDHLDNIADKGTCSLLSS